MKRKYLDYLVPFLLICLLFFGSWKLANHFFTKELLELQEEFLTNNGELLIHRLDLTRLDSEQNQTAIQDFAHEAHDRITLLDPKGRIIFDSAEPDLSGNRENRPEVKFVLNKNDIGSSVRYSTTLQAELLYTAQPMRSGDEIAGILRVAKKTSDFQSKTQNFQRTIFTILLLFYAFIYSIICYLTYQRNRPIETVLPVLQRMLKEPEKSNYVMQNSSQWRELYFTVNQISEQLNETYAAYTSTEEQFSTLFHELTIGVFIIDTEGRFMMINPAMEELLQIGGVSQHYYWQVIQDNKFIQLIQQVLVDKNQIHQEIATKLPNPRNLDIRLRYIENELKGDQVMGTVYDLTHVRRLEKIQRDFVGNVSHELKTPVTSLLGFTETLLDGAKYDPDLTEEFLTIMENDAKRLQRLIQDIIELSKDGDDLAEDRQALELNYFFQQQIGLYQHLLKNKQIRVTIDGAKNCFYQTRLTFFQPIIKNLLENAIQYSSKNSQIELSYHLSDQLIITVTDYGIGMSKDDQKRIFERFYRVDKARARHSGGTGLGLAIVKEYSEILGGTVKVESHPKLGSTFTVILPNN
ncbi:ATP-binding protein [Enterococcus dongliensis]|uniref:histidine kinase n=1 Tax=Enterococcus dongliensis TaxID=2559925 RepID=A0AAP5KU66_9ENTE|nr:ATP-binding protein [Enterococcus dongliensis]MDT2596971.1 ATP-binding protein [Enterococcus dongliensis]MDT2633335.1 ATP-binding protein [Enterococcus dongliensis]MDT2636686.1 ATP-binding protein [Enterococcus dongliensis]MDT2638805.1 ATP-binding protein [Enterococcus dongliensis]MDT2641443.1 ATP-binding protein [Enterococcus dongliensis]